MAQAEAVTAQRNSDLKPYFQPVVYNLKDAGVKKENTRKVYGPNENQPILKNMTLPEKYYME